MKLGLRLKSALALAASLAVVLALACLLGWRAIAAVEQNLGTAFARNATQLNKQRILGPVQRELALSQRLADSVVTRQMLLDENSAAKRNLFFQEAERYRQAFDDKSYFLISGNTRRYYFNDRKSAFSDKPRYVLSPKAPNDAWFFKSMKNTRDFNIEVNPDVKLKVTKVWFNVLVKDGQGKLGLAGTGMDLTAFLERFITSDTEGVTPMVLNTLGYIQAHPDRNLIDYGSVMDKGEDHSTIFKLLTRPDDHAQVRQAFAAAQANPDTIPTFWAEYQGKRDLFSVAYIPELSWLVLTAVDLQAARVLDSSLWLPLLVIGGALIVMLVVTLAIAVDRVLLAPLLALTGSVRKVAAGDYALQLPPAGQDELGELTRAVGTMAAQVATHTDELETRVSQRTAELVQVNQRMAEASKQIGDSIRYASMIQTAILPNQDMARALGGNYFVLWRPRDVVGGDFYVFRSTNQGCLLGVIDCAGHGVPGAFMTMIAYAALNVAMDVLGLEDPAALLAQVDERIRTMLHQDPKASQTATNMDAGLVYVNFEDKSLIFAGAKVSLYWSDGASVGEIRGGRHAIGGKRRAEFTSQMRPFNAHETFYLTTDGMLDQAGGVKGFSYGQERFEALIKRHAGLPFAEQQAAFEHELDAYRGTFSQRDDVTVISFRLGGE